MAQQWTERLGTTGAPRDSWSIRVSLGEDDVRRVRRWFWGMRTLIAAGHIEAMPQG